MSNDFLLSGMRAVLWGTAAALTFAAGVYDYISCFHDPEAAQFAIACLLIAAPAEYARSLT